MQVLHVLVDEEVELALAEHVVVAVVGHRAAAAAALAAPSGDAGARVRRRRLLISVFSRTSMGTSIYYVIVGRGRVHGKDDKVREVE